MRKEYDFSRGKRGAVVPSPGKTRITIMLDNEVLEYFRERADSLGTGYQTMRSEEHTSELQSLMRTSYAVFCLKKKKQLPNTTSTSSDYAQSTLNTNLN